ncbi:hypothetical protein EZS27_010187 [termite gut metagenome]|uniref:Uncharacterized protein n=1 Tax=termite gut metagenome TaxID=433724 RepID=A0A5J4S9V4_9ZZZZ
MKIPKFIAEVGYNHKEESRIRKIYSENNIVVFIVEILYKDTLFYFNNAYKR